MSNPWFRLYSEFAHDPKVQMMSEVMQRRYIMILCMRCSNVLVTLQETEVAFHLRISNEELAETKALFIEKGFIDSRWNLMNWEKRQFLSDSSNERVKRHRAKRLAQGLPQQNSIPPKVRLAVFDRDNCACIYCGSEEDLTIDHKIPQSRGGSDEIGNLATACRSCNASKRDLTDEEFALRKAGNVTVTPHIQKQITDTDKKNTEPVGFLKFWKTWPSTDRKQAKGKCLEAWKKAHGERDAAVILSHVEKLKSSNDWLKENGQYIPAPLVYLNGRKWDGAEVSTTPANNPFAGAI